MRTIFTLLLFFAMISCKQDPAQVGPYFTFLHHSDKHEVVRKLVLAQRAEASDLQAGLAGTTDQLLAHIEEMMRILLDSAGQEDPRLKPHHRPPPLDKLLDYKVSSKVLIGPEPAMAVDHPFSAYSLMIRLDDHKDELQRLTQLDPAYFEGMIPTGGHKASYHGFPESWHVAKFHQMTLLHALTELTLLKTDLLQLELSLSTMEREGTFSN